MREDALIQWLLDGDLWPLDPTVHGRIGGKLLRPAPDGGDTAWTCRPDRRHRADPPHSGARSPHRGRPFLRRPDPRALRGPVSRPGPRPCARGAGATRGDAHRRRRPVRARSPEAARKSSPTTIATSRAISTSRRFSAATIPDMALVVAFAGAHAGWLLRRGWRSVFRSA